MKGTSLRKTWRASLSAESEPSIKRRTPRAKDNQTMNDILYYSKKLMQLAQLAQGIREGEGTPEMRDMLQEVFRNIDMIERTLNP